MDFAHLLDLVLHVDKYLGDVIQHYGSLVYVLICGIVFCETCLIFMFFLPGDTLLFIGGTFCATGALNLWILAPLLFLSAVGGSTINYWIGSMIGHRAYTHNYRLLDKDALQKTHAFYEKYGGITMVLSRFVPVVRTFAPFVAGVSEMTWTRFQLFNVTGALLWVILLVSCGFFFGNIPILKNHLNAIVLIGVAAAVVPVALGSLWRVGKKMSRN